MNPAVLEPLAARYASWLRLPAAALRSSAGAEDEDPNDDDPEQVRAMPVILRVERTEPPARTALLEAAASAAIAVCLDPLAEPDGPWHAALAAWLDGRIRKVARRARGAHWEAVQALPGVTLTVAGAQVRALVPGRVVDTPKEVARLQISGSELAADNPGPPPPGVPVLWLSPAVPMTAGKAAAQVGHATMLLAALLHADARDDALAGWAAAGFRVAVRTPTPARWRALHPGEDPLPAWRSRRVIAVRDAGYTEVAPGTVTVLAQWPATSPTGS